MKWNILCLWNLLLLFFLKQLVIFFFTLQDNVFVQLICTIQYRVVKENADDAFYELQNPQQQIQAYVFDGELLALSFLGFAMFLSSIFWHLYFHEK